MGLGHQGAGPAQLHEAMVCVYIVCRACSGGVYLDTQCFLDHAAVALVAWYVRASEVIMLCSRSGSSGCTGTDGGMGIRGCFAVQWWHPQVRLLPWRWTCWWWLQYCLLPWASPAKT